MHKRFILLLAAVMVTSLVVIKTRHESRQLFVELQSFQSERDSLVIEWGKLLLEEGTWSQHRRVEDMARNRLGMSTPDSERVRVVRLYRSSTP